MSASRAAFIKPAAAGIKERNKKREEGEERDGKSMLINSLTSTQSHPSPRSSQHQNPSKLQLLNICWEL